MAEKDQTGNPVEGKGSRRRFIKEAISTAGAIAASSVVVPGAMAQKDAADRCDVDPEAIKKFFASLYEESAPCSPDRFDLAVTKIVSRQGKNAVVADQALQSLMINYVLADPKRSAEGRRMSAAIAGIKARSVAEFTKVFPNTTLETLIAAAKKDGYEVEVLKITK